MLYATGETLGTFENQQIKDFSFWVLIELLVNTVLILNSILYLVLRNLIRDAVTFSYQSPEDVNEYEDFMSGDIKILILNVFAQACMPATITTIL